MILFSIDQSSVDATVANIDHVKERVLVGIRLGMRDGIRALAQAEADAVASRTKSGYLEEILGRAGRVIETEDKITAIYRPRAQGKQPHYWLEYGAHVPAVADKLMAMNIAGQLIYRMGHKAFDISARPFFFQTADSFKSEFFQLLQCRVNQALTA
jgi:hypothetical protein